MRVSKGVIRSTALHNGNCSVVCTSIQNLSYWSHSCSTGINHPFGIHLPKHISPSLAYNWKRDRCSRSLAFLLKLHFGIQITIQVIKMTLLICIQINQNILLSGIFLNWKKLKLVQATQKYVETWRCLIWGLHYYKLSPHVYMLVLSLPHILCSYTLI